MTGAPGRRTSPRSRRFERMRTWSAALAGAGLLAIGVATQVDGSPVVLPPGPYSPTPAVSAAPAPGSATALNPATAPDPATAANPAAAPHRAAAPAKAEAPLVAGWRGEAAVRLGARITVRGTTAAPVGVVRIEQRVNRAWKPVSTATVTTPPGNGASSTRGTWTTTVTAPQSPSFQSYRAVWAHGRTLKAAVALPRLDVYRQHTYVVGTRGKLASSSAKFAQEAAAIYADRRGWKQAHHRFVRVTKGGDFTLWLSEAGKVPSFDRRCSVHYSCRSGRNVIINEKNWLNKTPNFVGDVATYRTMVINHETGHWLGLGHRYCAGKGRQAPVMQQQSKGMQGCTANGWPTSPEIKAVSR